MAMALEADFRFFGQSPWQRIGGQGTATVEEYEHQQKRIKKTP